LGGSGELVSSSFDIGFWVSLLRLASNGPVPLFCCQETDSLLDYSGTRDFDRVGWNEYLWSDSASFCIGSMDRNAAVV
jgi:hypothetical protein